MKQNRQTKHVGNFNVKMLLIAVLALVMAFALVACNGDKKDNNENNSDNSDNMELSDEMKQLVEESRADIDAAFNYFLSIEEAASENDYQLSVQYIQLYSMTAVSVQYDISDDKYAAVFIFLDEATAQENAQLYIDEFGDEVDVEGNKIIVGKTSYQKAAQSTRPSKITKFTDEQIAFMESKMHRGAGKGEGYVTARLGTIGAENEGVLFYIADEGDRVLIMESIQPYYEEYKEEIEEAKKLMPVNNITDDSYINVDENAGYLKYRIEYKEGWHMEANRPNGKYRVSYWYFYGTIQSNLVVPTKIGDCDIEKAEIYIYDDITTIESVTIEKPMVEVLLSGDIKQITIPVSDEAFVGIDDNTTLETINFGGTMDQWEALYGRSAQGWTHVHYYDYEADDYAYKDITFTVHCTNGDITYPKTNA